jgi:hypothetical protein
MMGYMLFGEQQGWSDENILFPGGKTRLNWKNCLFSAELV